MRPDVHGVNDNRSDPATWRYNVLLIDSMLYQGGGMPILRQLGRLVANTLLAYFLAGAIAFVFLAVARVVHPEPGATGVLASWGYGMFWLLAGLPLVATVLGLVDLAVYRVEEQRRVARIVSIVPALLLAPISGGLGAIPLVGWILATGLAFGHLMLLPARRLPSQA